MPTVILNRKVVEDSLGRKMSDETLSERIAMIGTDLKQLTKKEIHVEIFPNRPDMLSEQGFARALSSFIGAKKGLKKYSIKKSGIKVIVDRDLKDIRPYTVAAVVKNLKLDEEKIDEIIQIQEKLHTTFCRNRKKAAIGIYPLERITPPIYFKAMEPAKIKFMPLDIHREMNAYQILENHPKGKEYSHLLKGCRKYPVFMDSKNNVMSLTPIINSELTGKITPKTKEAFIEVSGHDLAYQETCLNIIAAALADMGAHVYSVDVMYGNKKITTPNLDPCKRKLNFDNVNRLLGLELSKQEIINLLSRMGYGYSGNDVLVPAYRADIKHEIDLIEDIAIAYGFENFKEEIPNVATIGQEDPIEVFKRKISEILVGMGMLETYTNCLTNKPNQCEKNNLKLNLVEVANPSTEDYTTLRSVLYPSLLEVFSTNKHNEYPQNIFEIGRVFNFGKSETGVVEDEILSAALCHKEADLTRIKQVVDTLLSGLGLSYSIESVDHPSFIIGRVASLKIGSAEIAVMGEVHPQVLENWEIEMPVSLFELNVSELFKVLNQ